MNENRTIELGNTREFRDELNSLVLAGLTAAASIGLRVRGAKRA